MPPADCIHAVDETVERGDHRLKSLSFDWYDFHILFFWCYCSFYCKGTHNTLSDNGFSESGSVLRWYGSHCPWTSYRTGSFRMNAVQTKSLTISQSDYLIVLYIVVWWNKVLVVWRVTTLRHEIIESMYHQIVGQALVYFLQYPVWQLFDKSFWQVFEFLGFHVFRSFIFWIIVRLNQVVTPWIWMISAQSVTDGF